MTAPHRTARFRAGRRRAARLLLPAGIALGLVSALAATPAPSFAEDTEDVPRWAARTAVAPARYARAGVAAADPATSGSWQTLPYSSPVRAIHAVLLNNGSVLLAAGSGSDPKTFAAGSFTATVWNPVTGAFTPVPLPWDMFCAGHAAMADGKILVAGGTIGYKSKTTPFKGSNRSYVFDPATNTFTPAPAMRTGRWYPTVVALGNGDHLAVAGFDENGVITPVPERFGADGTWQALPARTFPNYANLVLMADGRLFYSGVMTGAAGPTPPGIWNLQTNAYKQVYGLTDRAHRREGATVLLPPAQNQVVMTMGGGFPGIANTNLIDLKAATPKYVAGPPLPTAKGYVSAVILPDSTVFQTGGGVARNAPVYEASIYRPATKSFAPMAAPTVGRTYHSEALLLPDGRVAVLGGNPTVASFEMRIEIFSPPYLFKGTRPAITAAPTEITYGGGYDVSATVAAGATLTSAVLIRPSAVTHSTDPDQRSVDLAAVQTPTGVRITAPASGNLAPPGWYLLFVNDSAGRPSVAQWVHLS